MINDIEYLAAAAAKLLQLCPTLCDPRDGSPPGSPVPGILQARTLEWVAISFPNAWKWKVKVKSLSCVRLLVTSWTAAYQAPPPTGFSRQEYWSGVPLPSPIEYLVLCLLATCISSLEKCLFKFFAHIKNCVVFCWVVYIFWILYTCEIYDSQIFSPIC